MFSLSLQLAECKLRHHKERDVKTNVTNVC